MSTSSVLRHDLMWSIAALSVTVVLQIRYSLSFLPCLPSAHHSSLCSSLSFHSCYNPCSHLAFKNNNVNLKTKFAVLRIGVKLLGAAWKCMLRLYWSVQHALHYLVSSNETSKDCVILFFFSVQICVQGKKHPTSQWKFVYICH